MQMPRILQVIKALQELGLQQVGLYALYRLALRCGYYRIFFSKAKQNNKNRKPSGEVPLLRTNLWLQPGRQILASCLGKQGQARLLAEADEICTGKVRLFGQEQAIPLNFQTARPLMPWTECESETSSEDIKFTWEVARFGWACTLARAYHLSKDERYAQAFWHQTEIFLASNPPYLGPHWVSAQEVALRLIALVWSAQVFATSPYSTPERVAKLSTALANHAARIPPTLIYARAQNNNHLLSEAAGLYTAGLALPDHPQSKRWRELGWRWFERGLVAQIAADGVYSQHSTNYHRLMLQLALWINSLAKNEDLAFSLKVQTRLQASTCWLLALLDPTSGHVPNLGPNDGAYILPLTVCPFHDYRPVLQAASQAFLLEQACQAGLWDEMPLWFGAPANQQKPLTDTRPSPAVVRPAGSTTWAYLRAAQLDGRPGHADQLHLDLWWEGVNIALDPGTYRYNAPPPWDNALTHTGVHNTLTINGLEQMRRAGRFLYLERAQAQVIAQDERSITAQHNGYRHLGLIHQRIVALAASPEWIIEDILRSDGGQHPQKVFVALQWLLPDSEQFSINSDPNSATLEIATQKGPVRLEVCTGEGLESPVTVQLVRAGILIYGEGPVGPIWGWSSPTYGDKIPALSLRITAHVSLTGSSIPVFKSRFLLCTSC